MTRWGIGPKFALLTLVYSAFIWFLQEHFVPDWIFSGTHIAGLILIIIGSLLFIYPAVTIDRYFNNNKLRTKGLYSVVRHPIYASWICIIIPGIVLYWGSILGITIPFAAYLFFKMFIHIEDDYLQNKFGDNFLKYKSSVNSVFPKLKKFPTK